MVSSHTPNKVQYGGLSFGQEAGGQTGVKHSSRWFAGTYKQRTRSAGGGTAIFGITFSFPYLLHRYSIALLTQQYTYILYKLSSDIESCPHLTNQFSSKQLFIG